MQSKVQEEFVSWLPCSWFRLSQRLQCNDAALDSGGRSLGSIGHTQFSEQAVDVSFHSGLGDIQRGGDLLVTAPMHDLLKNIKLAGSQFFCTDAFCQTLRN